MPNQLDIWKVAEVYIPNELTPLCEPAATDYLILYISWPYRSIKILSQFLRFTPMAPLGMSWESWGIIMN
jgi:hypothetical protein